MHKKSPFRTYRWSCVSYLNRSKSDYLKENNLNDKKWSVRPITATTLYLKFRHLSRVISILLMMKLMKEIYFKGTPKSTSKIDTTEEQEEEEEELKERKQIISTTQRV